jgi:hypothetical protein
MRIGCIGLGRAPVFPDTLEEYLATMPRATREEDG